MALPVQQVTCNIVSKFGHLLDVIHNNFKRDTVIDVSRVGFKNKITEAEHLYLSTKLTFSLILVKKTVSYS